MTLAQKMFMAVEPVLQNIYHHPFVTGLGDGTLPRDQFVFYLQQDSLYLVDYAKALSLVAAKSSGEKDIALLLDFSKEALLAERSLHGQYFTLYQVEPTQEKAPACLMYTSFLLSCTALNSIAVGMAALLPCFWIYNEVGKHILSSRRPGNPYDAWIDLYAGEEFEEGVRLATAHVNRLAEKAGTEEREAMLSAFMQSSRLEYYFWDDAMRLHAWAV